MILVDNPEAGPEKVRLRLEPNNRLLMTTETGTAEYVRIAEFPLTLQTLRDISNDITTAGLEKSVEMILNYERTGELPVTKAAATRKETAMKAHSMNDLKQLAIALHNYQDVKKTFPAAINKQDDKGSKPYQRECYGNALLGTCWAGDCHRRQPGSNE